MLPVKSSSILLFLVFTVKILLLFVVVPYFDSLYPKLYSINEFPDHYADIAWNVASGAGYRIYPDTNETMIREPGYIYLLAMLFLLFGKNITIVKLANLLFSFMTAYFMFKMGEKLKINKLAVRLAVLFFLLHPAIILSESRAGVESLFITLVLITIYTLYVALDTNRSIHYAIAGVMIGVTTLTRSTILPFVLPFYIYLLISKHKTIPMRKIHLNMAVMIVSLSLVLSVWSIRNYRLAGTFNPLGTVLGDSLHSGLYTNLNYFSVKTYDQLSGEAAHEGNKINKELGIRFRSGFFATYYDVQDEIKHSNELKKIVFSKYRASPKLFVKCVLLNCYRFWFQGNTRKTVYLNIFLVGPILILSFVGIYLALKEKCNVHLLLLFMASFIVVHLPVMAHSRHHVSLIPFLMLLCGLSLSKLLFKLSFGPDDRSSPI